MNTEKPDFENGTNPWKSLRERIAEGECVSPYTAEHCPVCVDRCEAAHWRMEAQKTLNESLKKDS